MKKYKSKIGFGIVMFVLIIIIGTSIPMVIHRIWIGLLINGLVLGFVCYIILTTYYFICGNELIIKWTR